MSLAAFGGDPLMAPSIRRLVRAATTLRRNFWDVLDSDAVLIYQSTVYPLILVAGIQMWCTEIPRALDVALQDNVQDVWLALTIIGPLTTLLGVLWHERDQYASALIQMSGNVMAGTVFATYILAVVDENWAKGVFAPFVFAGLAVWSLLLGVRDLRKTLRVERQIGKR